ncbi:hypothetical protein [Escherichia coli]|uniref:hypothetical protein n=1 Tax=Escherichia coli TaxID=562 RepID=UPI00301CD8CA
MKTNMGSTKNGARVPHVLNRFTSMDIDMNSQILPDMLINFALINSKRLARTVLIFTEKSDQLSRATDRVPGLPASPGYAQ